MNLGPTTKSRLTLAATFAIAILLSVMPGPGWAEPFRPDWVGLVLIYWCMATPTRVGVGTGWLLGFIQDVLFGSLLGSHAIAKTLIAFITLKLHLQLRMFPRWQQAAAGLVLLMLRLAWLQIFSHRHYETLSRANRVRPIPIPQPRGLILDRNGVVLAQNYPVYALEVVPEQVDDMNPLLEQLGELVQLSDTDLKNFRKQLRERPRFEALTLRANLSDEEAARVAVTRPYLFGVEVQARLQRHYPLGGLGVHAIGYVGRISEPDLERLDKATYRGMRHVGKLGIEATYEKELLGRVGFEKMETNAHGRALRALERTAPVAGKNLALSLDAKLQAIAEQALGSRRGAVIALEPATGAILAFASTPTYN